MASPPSQPSSLSLQSSKAVQGLTGLRNLGNTVSVSPGLWLICGAGGALFLHLAPNTHTLTLAAPCTPLPTVLPEKELPLLLTAVSPSSARPPQVSPCHGRPPSASRCHGFLFCLPQCFMNSILQCLSNTKELRDYCLQNQYLRDLNNNSRMRTALMTGNGPAPGLAAAGASLQQLLQHIPATHPWDTPRPVGPPPRAPSSSLGCPARGGSGPETPECSPELSPWATSAAELPPCLQSLQS